MSSAVLNDITRCVGCGACAIACREINELPPGQARGLDANHFTFVEARGSLFVRRMCLHCEEPACASVCPVGALRKTAEGPVAYDAGKCIGCRYCMVACPFMVPKYQWQKQLPVVRKCLMCYDKRVKLGRQPACTQVCPTGATLFGEREALLAEARRRIEREPRRYVNHIFGEREAGGTSVLYLAPVPFGQLGFPTDIYEEPYPHFTWEILRFVPTIFGGGGALLMGTAWVIQRRMEFARQACEAAAKETEEERGEQ